LAVELNSKTVQGLQIIFKNNSKTFWSIKIQGRFKGSPGLQADSGTL